MGSGQRSRGIPKMAVMTKNITNKVKNTFGGMWDESEKGRGMLDERNFNGAMRDEKTSEVVGYRKPRIKKVTRRTR